MSFSVALGLLLLSSKKKYSASRMRRAKLNIINVGCLFRPITLITSNIQERIPRDAMVVDEKEPLYNIGVD